ALGLVLLSYKGSFSRYQSLLIGDILSISKDELIVLAIMLPVGALLWVICFNRFHSISISPELAAGKGIPVRLLDNIFVVVVAVVVMIAINWVGLLIINAMLILPAAAARHIAKNTRSYHLTALIFGLFSGFLGLWLSYKISVATGPAIVLISAILYFATFMVREKR
ncbi:MAG: metal ABC transporter permease, partial [Oscillospiraceae bacterium]|nr:metal ABC transporter permease [Oscillospiraceae bacterium]